MCGIAGIVAPQGLDPAVLVAMTQLIQYRGPDGFGFAFVQTDSQRPVIIHNHERPLLASRPVVGLGNRRLAILDVSSAGNQPMQSPDGAHTITFNGEIYNYKEIREDLEFLGHRFLTHTDTEVILNSYRQWGPDCLQHFNGMWAFALWDHVEQKLFCSRDRFGVKPFYYCLHDGQFFFASEIKQILQATNIARVANPRTSFHFLEWGLLDYSAETFFEGIYQLPGGHTLTLELQLPLKPVVRRYWELRTEQRKFTDRDATHEFATLFERAVKIRLRSDVPVGIALSGGLDSSAVLCKAKEIAPATHFQTFSACFDDAEIDEREYIAAALTQAQAQGHVTLPQGTAFWNHLRRLIYHHDEPVGSTAAYAQWCVMAEARAKGIPVILGGQGGDESLCGYQKYHFFYLWHLLSHADPRFLRESIMWARQGTSSYSALDSAARYLPEVFRASFSLTKRIGTENLNEVWLTAQSGLGASHSIAERQKTDLTYSSIPALLHHEDRSSMAHSVESRLPFLDYQLVEFLLRCPASLKLRDGWSKWLLRQALVGTLPEKIRLRKTKLGFNTPEKKWMHFGLQNGHRHVWESPNLRMNRFMDGPRFQEECRKFVSGSRGALPPGTLFRAISLEQWAHVHSVS